jgi:hypothetical protein
MHTKILCCIRIPDPSAKKPDDWDESEPELIPDPKDKKPAGWRDDIAPFIPDPSKKKPADAPLDWRQPLIRKLYAQNFNMGISPNTCSKSCMSKATMWGVEAKNDFQSEVPGKVEASHD